MSDPQHETGRNGCAKQSKNECGRNAEFVTHDAAPDYAINGFKIIPTGRGSDFIAKKLNEAKKQQEYVEVKTGKSRPTKKQKMVMKMAKKSGHRYTIYRVTDAFLESYLNSKNLRMEIP